MERVATSHAQTARKWSERAEEVTTWTTQPGDSRVRWPANRLREAQALARAELGPEGADSSGGGPSSLPRPSYTLDIVRGLSAYAHRQSNTWLGIGASCVRTWAPFLRASKLEVRWPGEYVSVAERSLGVIEEDVTERGVGASGGSANDQGEGTQCIVQFSLGILY